MVPGFRDPALPFRERASDLLGRLTEAEKIEMLHQCSPSVPRLGLAAFRTGIEGIHGASWRDGDGDRKTLPATVFPQPVGFAASWDPELAGRLGRATGLEIRGLHSQRPKINMNVWAPVVNLLRDPRWGRNEEGYSEDPLLSADMGTAFCRGLAGDDENGYLLTAPTLKHFLAYNNEDDRVLTSSGLRPRVLHEYDLPPFREPVRSGAATGVMPSYNLVNGRPAHVSPLLDLVRSWTGDELLFNSDAEAPSNLARAEHYYPGQAEGHAAALRAGVDSFTDQGSNTSLTVGAVTEALRRGLITMADVDRAVRRKLLIRLRLGEFDPGGGPFAGAGVMDTAGHRELARTAARRSAVLLRNEGGLLPLDGERPGTIAVVGPLADTLYEDWYSPAMRYAVTVADGLKAAGAEVTVCEAARRVRTDLGEFEVFDWEDDVITLRSAETGKYLTLTDGAWGTGAGGSELRATEDKPDDWNVRETFRADPLPDGAVLLRSVLTGEAGRLRWDPLSDGVTEAVAAARGADAAVIVVGNDPMIGGRETRDRGTIHLPESTARLVREVTGANPRTILVIMSSYPYVTPDAPAILWTSHAGQETGHALADLLFGRHAPEGRLPQTWYASDDDLPPALDYDIIKAGWTYQYLRSEPRFPFGHGLGYTTFGYGPLSLDGTAGGTVTATLDITNTGDREGTEVVQLYARYTGPDQPKNRLAGYTRVTLAPGETRTARIEVPAERLALWDVAAGRMTVPPGQIEIGAGASSAGIRRTATLDIPGSRSVRPLRFAAAGFDDYSNIALTDTSPEDGTAVTPADPARPAWLKFANLSPERIELAVARAACPAPAGGAIELWLAPPGDGGKPAASVVVPDTGGRYEWTEVTVPLGLDDPPGELYVVLRGAVRLDWIRLGSAV